MPQLPDPSKIMSAGVESVGDLLNTGVRSINTFGAGLQNSASRVASAASLPVLPQGLPPIPEVPSPISGQGLPGLPAVPFGLPAFPGMPGAGGGGNGGAGAGAGSQSAAKEAPAGYGERNGKSCVRAAGAGKLGYGEM